MVHFCLLQYAKLIIRNPNINDFIKACESYGRLKKTLLKPGLKPVEAVKGFFFTVSEAYHISTSGLHTSQQVATNHHTT